MVKNSREFSLLDLDLEAFWFHFSLLEKEWKHFIFTLHFSKKSESIFFHFALFEKEWRLFFHFALLGKEWKLLFFTFHFANFPNPFSLVPANKPLFSNCQALCCHQQHQNQQYVMHTEMKKNDRVSQSPCIQLQHAAADCQDTSQLIINNWCFNQNDFMGPPIIQLACM